MSDELTSKDRLYWEYRNQISSNIIDNTDASKQIIKILGGVSNILRSYLTNQSLSLDQKQLHKIYQVLSTTFSTEDTKHDFIASKLFCGWRDQFQYKSFFLTLKLLKKEIPTSIIKEISEFSVGTIKKCDNFEKCKQEFSILHSDHHTATQLNFNEADDEYDMGWRMERADIAVSQIGYFRCDNKIFCKQCIQHGEVERCAKCNKMCCTYGFQCDVCNDEWFACCDSCIGYCTLCGNANNILGYDYNHRNCHSVLQCICGTKFCPSSFTDTKVDVDEFGWFKNIDSCPKCHSRKRENSDIKGVK